MSLKHISFKENTNEINNYSSIKALLREKKLNPNRISDLKYLLSLTINPDINRFNYKILLNYLLKYLQDDTLPIFTEFFFSKL